MSQVKPRLSLPDVLPGLVDEIASVMKNTRIHGCLVFYNTTVLFKRHVGGAHCKLVLSDGSRRRGALQDSVPTTPFVLLVVKVQSL